MDIYFSGSISGGRNYLETYQEIVAYLKSQNHQVLSEHVAQPNILDLESNFPDKYVFQRDIQMLERSDCVIAEVSNPSLGVGYEICHALHINKPVLCLYLKGVFLTRMLTGNTSPLLTIKDYQANEDWTTSIKQFLKTIKK